MSQKNKKKGEPTQIVVGEGGNDTHRESQQNFHLKKTQRVMNQQKKWRSETIKARECVCVRESDWESRWSDGG